MSSPEKYIVVVSDCHLSAGRFFEGRLNPHEDFHFDREMCDLFDYFSNGKFGMGLAGPVEVELFINGDYLDFLNVPVQGEFEDAVTEEASLSKLEAIIKGHPEVMTALKRFASRPGKKITYLIGNHDADLFFPKIRERITREWDPGGQFPSEKVQVIAHTDRVRFEGGVEIHHGNQFEAVHFLDFKKPFLESPRSQPLLSLPWGSLYVLRIINRMKWEREHIDKVRPIRRFVFFSLFMDPWFTIRFVFLSALYFFRTRFVSSPKRHSSLKMTLEILRQEVDFFMDLERQARKILDQEKEVRTIVFGHNHEPVNKVYPDGKQYINTGTWTKMINLDWRTIGQQFCLTFALIHIKDGQSRSELRQWVGEHSPHTSFQN